MSLLYVCEGNALVRLCICIGLPEPSLLTYGPWRKKTCLQGFANNKGADQPVHPHRLISAIVIRFLVSTISKHASSEISMF